MIARCGGVADVADAVELGRKLALEVAIRGGGHNLLARLAVSSTHRARIWG